MSCFWKGIIQALTPEFKAKHNIRDPASLLQFFKKINQPTVFFRQDAQPVIEHQSTVLTQTQLLENMRWVSEYDSAQLASGHYTSTCDPFLILLTCFCDCSVEHLYNKEHKIVYNNLFNHSGLWLIFQSDRGHFWFVKREIRAV